MTNGPERSLFVEIWFDLSLNLLKTTEPEKPLESTDCEKVTPPGRGSVPGWVVVVGAGGGEELRARRAAMRYLLTRTRPALSAARDYFHARDLVAAAENLEQHNRASSKLSVEVRNAAEFLDECDEFSRSTAW